MFLTIGFVRVVSMFFSNRNTKANQAQQDQLKLKVAQAAIEYIQSDMTIAIGTGSTVNFFIDALVEIRPRIDLIVSSSTKTAEYLTERDFKIADINYPDKIDLYIDGADEANQYKVLIKGGGGALTGEKICRVMSDRFICMIDESKLVQRFGSFPIAVEVIPEARSYVAKALVKLGGQPVYREGFVTDNGNIILDVYHMEIINPIELERKINQLVGVVCNGIFAVFPADTLLVARKSGAVEVIE